MKDDRSISVIIPAINEEASIGKVIADIPQWVDEIIVVDNGSTDKTVAVAQAHGARVIYEAERGYGAACLAGIA
ncbi:MAG: glycosyltransferase, partial [Calditrichaeota bacterium]|nr:glycosyltransferase [Calditrichota bacterium]